MKLYKKFTLAGNNKVTLILLIVSILLFFIFWYFFSLIPVIRAREITSGFFDFVDILAIFIGYFLLIIIHEGIHGLFFKIFNPQGKVLFGLKLPALAYATSPGNYYSKYQFAVIGLAPFFLITLGLLAAYQTGLINQITFVLIASIHGAGCVGDFYYMALLMRLPQNILIEDTPQALLIYQKEN